MQVYNKERKKCREKTKIGFILHSFTLKWKAKKREREQWQLILHTLNGWVGEEREKSEFCKDAKI